MRKSASFFELALEVGAVFAVTSLDREGCFTEISPPFVLLAIIGDSTWVVLSIALLLIARVPFSAEGKWAIGIIAVIMDVFTALQLLE